MAPRRPPPDAVTEHNWPLICAAVALRLHEWLVADEDEEPLLEEPKGVTRSAAIRCNQRSSEAIDETQIGSSTKGGTRSAHAATPLQRAVWAIWAAPPTTYVAAHAALSMAEQLALLAMLVDGASQTAAAARAAEARHAESTLLAAELHPKPGARSDHTTLVSTVRDELARLARLGAGKKRKSDGPSAEGGLCDVPTGGKKRKSDGPSAVAEGSLCDASQLEMVRHVAERHGLQGRVELLTRAELEACELELLL